MLDYYILEGTEYSKEEVLSAAGAKGLTIDAYIQQYYPEDFMGKQVDSTVDPTVSQENMGSQLGDGSSEPVSWFDQTWFGRGVAAASTTGEATGLMSEDFSNINIESIQDFIKAKAEESKSHVPSERMEKFQKKYKEEGSTWSTWFTTRVICTIFRYSNWYCY